MCGLVGRCTRADVTVSAAEVERALAPIRHRGPDGDGPGRCFVLVHGLASNARLWDGVAARLAAAGHPVLAVDQRGHGRSEEPADGYTTDRCADDLLALTEVLGLVGDRAPVAVGKSWGGNVVVSSSGAC